MTQRSNSLSLKIKILHFLAVIGSTLYKNEVIIIYWRGFSEGTPEKHKRVAVCEGNWEKYQASVGKSL